jgi:hypothetical protein
VCVCVCVCVYVSPWGRVGAEAACEGRRGVADTSSEEKRAPQHAAGVAMVRMQAASTEAPCLSTGRRTLQRRRAPTARHGPLTHSVDASAQVLTRPLLHPHTNTHTHKHSHTNTHTQTHTRKQGSADDASRGAAPSPPCSLRSCSSCAASPPARAAAPPPATPPAPTASASGTPAPRRCTEGR